MKGFVRIFEVVLAISIIFIVINNIYTAIPPRYQDTQGINWLHRNAEDVAFSLCYNDWFREDLTNGFIPVNLSLRADAWNKSMFTFYGGGASLNATFRQVTQINKSSNKIRFCINSSSANVGGEFSICERSSEDDCVSGTFSEDVILPSSSSANFSCTDWTNYVLSKDKIYLLNFYTSEFVDFNYYCNDSATGWNGFYYKVNVDDTQNEIVDGYTVIVNNCAMEVKIDIYHDLELDTVVDPSLGYHIWLYSNNSFDWKLDDLINESGNDPGNTVATSSCLIKGYEGVYSPKKIVVGVWNEYGN